MPDHSTELPKVTLTELRRRFGSILGRVEQGPILVTARNKPVAVLLYPDLLDRMNAEIDRLTEQTRKESDTNA